MKLKKNNIMLHVLRNVFQVLKRNFLFLTILLLAINGYGQVINIEDVSGNENDGAITLTATYTGPFVLGGFTVDVSTSDDTALVSDSDYTAIVSQTLNFSGLSGSFDTFVVTPTGDTNIESSENLVVSMNNLVGVFSFVSIIDTATVTIVNDDVGTVRVIESLPNADEAGPVNGRFQLRLSDDNNTDAALTVSYTLTGDAGITQDYTITVNNTIAIGGDRSNINVFPVDDSLVETDETVILTITGTSSTSFIPLVGSESGTVTITDNDNAGVNVSAVSGNTTEAGGIATFRVTLDSQPTAPVTMLLTSTKPGEGTVPATVVVPVASWETGVPVTVTGVDDLIVDGDQSYSITTGDVTSIDTNYNSLTGASVDNVSGIVNEDDDVAGVNINTTTGITTEAGGTVDFIFTLTNEPSANVTILINGYDATETSGPASIEITPSNWNTGVILTIEGVDDNSIDGDIVDTIITGNVSSADLNYNVLTGGNVPQLTVTNTDDDLAGVNINTLTGTTTEAGDISADFLFTLTSEPSANVTILINGYDDTETSGPASIEITPSNWNTGVILTIEGVDDNIIDGNIDDIINTRNVTSTDLNYNALNGASVPQLTVTNIDDDGCGTTPIAINEVQNNNGIVSFCGVISANLNDYTTTVPPTGMVLIWSQNSNPISAVGRLTQTESENITSEGSFFGYFYDADNDCAGGVLEIEIELNAIPTIDSVEGGSICSTGVLLLSATASDGASIKWFDSLTGGTELATGNEYTTDSLDNTTFFYVQAEANDCISERVEVVATIIPALSTSNSVACNLTSTGQILSTIDLDNSILSSPDAGEWSFVSGPTTISIDTENEVDFVDQPTGNYIFRHTITGTLTPCIGAFAEITITVISDCTPDPIDLEILKSVSNANAIAGENVIFTVTLNNLSDRNVQNIIVGDLIETGFDYVADIPSIGNYDLATGSWLISELEAMATVTLEIEVTVLSEGLYTNTAELLESFPADNNSANDSAEVSLIIDVQEEVDLAIEKTVKIENTKNTGPRANPLAGDEVVFTIRVINLSEEVTVNQIRVSDVIEAPEFLYVSHSTINGEYDSESGIWLIPELLTRAEVVLEITVSVPAEGVFTNVATIVSSIPAQTDSNEEENNNSASAEVNVSLPTIADCGFMFNQFSPNGDGTNDYLKIQCIEQYPTNRLQIYDRYGNQVYVKAGYTNDWSGDGENGQVPDGTYFYLLDLGNGSEIQKGWIQLIR